MRQIHGNSVYLLCGLMAALLCCLSPLYAQDQEAARPLVPKYLNRMLDPLKNDQEAFLIVTAGGSSTDVLVIANPSVPPAHVVQALHRTVAGTLLGSQSVEWSGPTERIPWSAAHCELRLGHPGAWEAVNTVPMAALRDGLQQAGFKPYPSLHLPVSVSCGGLPSPYADFNGDRWYFLGKIHSRRPLLVSNTIAPNDLLPLLLPLLVIPLIGLAAQAVAVRWARTRDTERQQRKRFDLFCNAPTGFALISWMIGTMFSIDKLHSLNAINDIWFGQIGSNNLFSVWFVSILLGFLLTTWNAQRLSLRLYGPAGKLPAGMMSSQERSLQERETLWAAAVPISLCLVTLIYVAGGSRALPSWLPPQTISLFSLLLLLPLVWYFQKKRKAFTTLVPAQALTDILRHQVAAPGQISSEVLIEQSGRAAAYAFLEPGKGRQVIVSQKLTEIATPEQMAFLLTAQSLRGRTGDGSKFLVLAMLAVLVGLSLGAKSLAALGHTAFFSVTLTIIFGIFIAMVTSLAITSQRSKKQMLDADKAALRLTGNREAALSGLTVLRDNAIPPANSSARQSQVSIQIAQRIAALSAQN